jgi:hypothetical protein
MYFVY